MIELCGLKLKINDKEIEISIEEAKKLHEQLDILFKKETNWLPSTWPSTNPLIDKPYQPNIWCGGSSAGIAI